MSDIQQAVRDRYGAIANAVTRGASRQGCCGPTACGGGDPITTNLYRMRRPTNCRPMLCPRRLAAAIRPR